MESEYGGYDGFIPDQSLDDKKQTTLTDASILIEQLGAIDLDHTNYEGLRLAHRLVIILQMKLGLLQEDILEMINADPNSP